MAQNLYSNIKKKAGKSLLLIFFNCHNNILGTLYLFAFLFEINLPIK